MSYYLKRKEAQGEWLVWMLLNPISPSRSNETFIGTFTKGEGKMYLELQVNLLDSLGYLKLETILKFVESRLPEYQRLSRQKNDAQNINVYLWNTKSLNIILLLI